MMWLMMHIRTGILIFSALLAAGIYGYVLLTIPMGGLQTIRLVQLYAFCAITFLYLALLASPLYAVFPALPYRPLYIKARRSLGVSAAFFALLHASLAFFGLLGGFPGLGFLPSNYLVAITLGATALTILLIMTATSLDRMVRALGPNWKKVHRFVYIAALLIVIHALLIGTHFAKVNSLIPEIVFTAIGFLLILEAIRFDRYLSVRHSFWPKIGLSVGVVVLALIGVAVFIYVPANGIQSLGIHAQHLQLAREAQNPQSSPTSTIPGLTGDRTKRYTVSFSAGAAAAGQSTPLTFQVYDAANGNPVSLFTPVYEKLMHTIIVNNDLTFFDHVHPTQNGSAFTLPYTFPKNDRYRIYTDFQPVGAIEQQFGFTLPVGDVSTLASPSARPDTQFTKQFGEYNVTFKPSSPVLKSQPLSLGQQTLSFTVTNAAIGQPITTLHPYLGAFGHLVMINEQTYEYIHAHPTTVKPPQPTDRSGPTVTFQPLGLYGPIKPGVYRVFAQLNPDGKLTVADFTVRVE